MDCSPPGSSVHEILQARTLEWVAMSSSRNSSRPRDRTCISYVSCTGRWVLTTIATWEAPEWSRLHIKWGPEIKSAGADFSLKSFLRKGKKYAYKIIISPYVLYHFWTIFVFFFFVTSSSQISRYGLVNPWAWIFARAITSYFTKPLNLISSYVKLGIIIPNLLMSTSVKDIINEKMTVIENMVCKNLILKW